VRRDGFRRAPSALLLACAAALAAAGCATPGETSEADPWEGFNRRIFWFNEQLDEYALEPVARGWDAMTSPRVQRSVDDFFNNLAMPVHLVNNVAQGKLGDAGIELARFVVNTTVGLLGFFDPATGWGLPDKPEDFGQTLAVWGLPSGPYLMLPIFGPSNPRDTVGLVGDGITYEAAYDEAGEVMLGARVIDIVNTRAQLLQPLREARQASVDYYVFVRNAYLQRRRIAIQGQLEQQTPAEQHETDDFYDEDLATEPADAPQP
jgi:phospholipid-binding lipoprotein MlaA